MLNIKTKYLYIENFFLKRVEFSLQNVEIKKVGVKHKSFHITASFVVSDKSIGPIIIVTDVS